MDWSEDIVDFLELIRSKSVEYSAKHQQSFFYYRSCEHYFAIPTIVLSVFSSFISVGVSDYVEQEAISTTTASISMAIAILGSIRLYLNLTLNVALELELSKEFHVLALDISKELFLPIELRKQTQQEFLEAVYGAYIGLLQKSSLIKAGPGALTGGASAVHEVAAQKNKLSPR